MIIKEMFMSLKSLNNEIIKNSKIIFSMGFKDFKNEYAGSALGFIWGILKPFVMVFAYWFVFSIGFKSQPINNVPYVAWLVPGLFAWTFLSDSLINGSSSIRTNAHLVKKVVFPIGVLPVIRIYAMFLNHLIFMTIASILILLSGIKFNFYTLQIFYYMICAIVLMIGITRLLSAMVAMSVDVMHFIITFIQLLFWATPVIWSSTQIIGLPQYIVNGLKINPFFYVVQGYRDSFFTKELFFHHWAYTLYFWIFILLLYLIGSYYFQRSRKEFADVL